MRLSFIRYPLQWYTTKLDTHPITTKCISSGLISGSGDMLCQYLINAKKVDTTIPASMVGNENERDNHIKNSECSFDWIRTMNFSILGSFLVAPTVHVWYGYLMSSIPGKSIAAIGKRLFYDQGLFAPLFLPTFVTCLTILEHINVPMTDKHDDEVILQKNNKHGNEDNDLLSHITNRLINDVPQAIVVGWTIWIPSMAVMFAFIPSKFQVLYSNGVGFVWNAYLSWRTHEGEEIRKKE